MTTPTPETYGAYLNSALTIARSERGMEGVLEFIMFELDEECAKMVLAHVVNLIIEWERLHPQEADRVDNT